MKGHVDKSMEIVTLITEVLTKINPKILRVPVEEQISKCFEMENWKAWGGQPAVEGKGGVTLGGGKVKGSGNKNKKE